MAEKRPVKTDEDETEKKKSTTLNTGLGHNSEGNSVENEPKIYNKLRSLTLGRRYKSKSLDGPESGGSEGSKDKRKGRWNFRLNYKLRSSATETPDIPETGSDGNCSCVCTGYRRTEEHHLGAGVVFDSTPSLPSTNSSRSDSDISTSSRTRKGVRTGRSTSGKKVVAVMREPIIDFSKFNPDDYPTEDCDEKARAQRAWEMEEGVDPPPGYNPSVKEDDVNKSVELRERHAFTVQLTMLSVPRSPRNSAVPRSSGALMEEYRQHFTWANFTECVPQVAHSQVDYIHCLVPDLLEISNCGFYWGKMDRYEAERLLENKQEGTFLLRDSAQEDYLFSVSFRRYGRSLHARIEQWNHKFSFDSHDPGVFSSDTVCGLIEHYKDPSCCMFFEPMLTIPLYRTFTFLLQHLCRSSICRMVTYDGVNQLQLPKPLKAYLKEYHYKQRVRLRRLDVEQ